MSELIEKIYYLIFLFIHKRQAIQHPEIEYFSKLITELEEYDWANINFALPVSRFVYKKILDDLKYLLKWMWIKNGKISKIYLEEEILNNLTVFITKKKNKLIPIELLILKGDNLVAQKCKYKIVKRKPQITIFSPGRIEFKYVPNSKIDLSLNFINIPLNVSNSIWHDAFVDSYHLFRAVKSVFIIEDINEKSYLLNGTIIIGCHILTADILYTASTYSSSLILPKNLAINNFDVLRKYKYLFNYMDFYGHHVNDRILINPNNWC